VNTREITEFREANYDTGVQAAALMNARVSAIGDCGEDFAITAVLSEDAAEKTVYDLVVDQAAIMSEAGQDFEQTIHRDALCYKFTVTITASDAQSVEAHLALTTSGDGFVNILTASDVEDKCFQGTKCNLDIESFEFDKFEEVKDWSEGVNVFFNAVVFAETSCQGFEATLNAYYQDFEEIAGTTPGTSEFATPLEEHGMYEFTSVAVEAENLQGDYFGELIVSNAEQTADTATARTEASTWNPPCYLYVDTFKENGSSVSLSEDKVALDLQISLSHEGDNACNSMSALVTISHGENVEFMHFLSASDLEAAIEGSFDFTVIVPSNEAAVAMIAFSDDNAADDATDLIDPAYVPESATSCEIQVREFCLTSMEPAEEQGRYIFTFDLTVIAAPICENLEATLDLANAQGEYLGNVSLDHDELIDAIECDCDKQFVVTADAESAYGDFYGQLVVREAASGLVEITDSCVLTKESGK